MVFSRFLIAVMWNFNRGFSRESEKKLQKGDEPQMLWCGILTGVFPEKAEKNQRARDVLVWDFDRGFGHNTRKTGSLKERRNIFSSS